MAEHSVHFNNRNRSRSTRADGSPAVVELCRPSDHYNMYMPPPRAKLDVASRFLKDPLTTTLSSFGKMATFVLGDRETYDSWLDVVQKGDSSDDTLEEPFIPPPALPSIQSTKSAHRLQPLSSDEFQEAYLNADLRHVYERVFNGGIATHVLRRKLWPRILGITENFDTFDWTTHECLYYQYEQQWMNILPGQEERFTAFRERKSIAERDVVRCDRAHDFFKSDSSENIEKLRRLLMTYIMYDFDTGYVQGMSDLASPLLVVWDGDLVKSFWSFVEVMKLFKRNFELSQNAMSFQLKMLLKLINLSDPCFSQYLKQKEADNCFFAFRWIICLFKREFMKEKTDTYDDCLIVWETLWSVNAISCSSVTPARAISPNQCQKGERNEDACSSSSDATAHNEALIESKYAEKKQVLTSVELFVLCICLSIIRRERDLIMLGKYDACEILKHFNNLSLTGSMKEILKDATTIWYWLKDDKGEKSLYEEEKEMNNSSEDFDLLTDDSYHFNALNV